MSAVRVKAAALLLDMDGTLVHSTGDVEVVWRRWCQHHGLDPAPVLAMCHGVRSREVIGALAPQLDVAVEVTLLDDLEMEYAAAPMPLDGARRRLEQLPSTRWALVTSASRIPSLICWLPAGWDWLRPIAWCSRMRQRASPAPCRRVARWCRWGEQGGMTAGSRAGCGTGAGSRSR